MEFKKEMTGFYIHSVCLPDKVKREMNNLVGKVLKLTMDGHVIWRVGLLKTGDKLVLQAGWSKFARDNNIIQNDILLFKLVNKSTFQVRIFDQFEREIDGFEDKAKEVDAEDLNLHPSAKQLIVRDCHTVKFSRKRSRRGHCGSDLEPPLMKQRKVSRCSTLVEANSASNSRVVQVLPTDKKKKTLERQDEEQREARINDIRDNECHSQESVHLENGQNETAIPVDFFRSHQQWIRMSDDEKERTRHLALELQAGNPAFLHVVQGTCQTTRSCINVPVEFSSKHLQPGTHEILLRCPERETTWIAACVVKEYEFQPRSRIRGNSCSNLFQTRSRIRGNSCSNFFKDNNLKKGDICLFELDKAADHALTFLVHVYRAP